MLSPHTLSYICPCRSPDRVIIPSKFFTYCTSWRVARYYEVRLLETAGFPSERISTGTDVIFCFEFYNFHVKRANDTACFVILLESLVAQDDGNDCVTNMIVSVWHLYYKTWRYVFWLLNVTD